jgi:hypothetical protein
MKPVQNLFRSTLAAALMVMCVLASTEARAQSTLEDALRQYSGDAVKGYIQPIADLFGANMNAGLYSTANIPVAGLTFGFEIVVMGASVGDDQKSYTAKAPSGFNPGTFKTATIFGGKGTEVTDQNTGFKYKGSDGLINASLFPLAVPQLTIGSLYGTVVTIRYIPVPEIGDGKFPKTTLFGIGARHSVSQYFEVLPLDVSAGFFYSSMTIGDLLDFKGLSIGAQGSKSFAILTIYGGLAWEKSTLTLSYKTTDPNATAPNVNVDLDGANNFRFTIGAGLSLAVLKLRIDANFGSVTNFSAGLGFGI